MRRPSLWMMIVVLLSGVLFLREPRLQRSEEYFLRWLLANSEPHGSPAPLTVVEIGREPVMELGSATNNPTEKFLHGSGTAISPLEYALFLQAALELKPTVIAFEPILKFHEREKDQEQVFIDQAMRVPKLVLAAELATTVDPDAPVSEIPAFTSVTGRRGDLPEFSSIGRQPGEDLRFISTLGFINLPDEIADEIHVPLLFQYRGEVVPSFALQAALLWLRVPLSEVKIDIGSFIELPTGKKIPIRSNGTALINPITTRRARHISLNELLLAAQQQEKGTAPAARSEEMKDQIILARTPANPLGPRDVFAATIATLETNSFIHRVSRTFDWIILLLALGLSGIVRRFSRVDLVLVAFAFSAAYCLLAIAILSRWFLWLPGVLPLGAVWLLAMLCLFSPRRKEDPDLPAVSPPPPSL
ncbi:MAG TPA: hypothetical protein VJ252_01475 [Chthoniobacterales bacterium]|nr:hypothetical protein [Chthoniobacterales bacterium]